MNFNQFIGGGQVYLFHSPTLFPPRVYILYLKKMNARLAILEFFCWNIITFQYFVFKPVPQSQLQSLNCKTRTISTVCRVLINQGKLQKGFGVFEEPQL